MTTAKKKSVRAPMELDLDSLLRSHGGHLSSSDEESDGDSAAFPRRTVDEILNDSDSSSSSDDSSSSPPRTSILAQKEQIFTSKRQQESADEYSAQTLEKDKEEESSFTWRRSRSRDLLSSSSSSAASLSSLGFRAAASSSARPLPPLFGGVRPSPKPGAALAAAAAASRTIPTPHAAAIKNRRAGSSGSIQKVESSVDLLEIEDFSDVVASSVANDGQLETSAAISRFSSCSSVEAKVTAGTEEIAKEELTEGVEESCYVEEGENTLSEEAKEDNLEEELVASNLPVGSPAIAKENNLEEELVTSNLPVGSPAIADENAQHLVDVSPLQDVLSLQCAAVSTAHNMHRIHNEEEGLKMPNDERCFTSEKIAIGDEELGSGSDMKATDGGELDGEIGEEAGMGDEIDKMVEERLEQLESNEKAKKKAEKKLRASMKPLERAEELEKRHASYGLHWEEGAAAQPMRLEGIQRGPPAVGYLQMDLDNAVTRTISSQTFKRDHGSPLALAVHMNFVAVGTSKGSVLVFPSKYSAHSPDHMDSKMLTFGSHGAKSQAAVTSMCFNQLGDLLLVGYFDGNLTIWDVQRATLAKVITDQHAAPVVHALFLGQFKAVTGDSKGHASLHTISVGLVFNNYSVKSQCLLDGQKNGVVLSVSPLLMDGSHGIGNSSAQSNSMASTSGLGSMVGGVVGGVVGGEAGWKLFNEGSSLVEEGVVIFVHHQNALVVRLTPEARFYDTFPKPDGVREGSMPYAAWNCMRHPHDSSPDSSENAPWLVIAWDRRVQVAQLVKSKMKNFREWGLDSAAIGVAWLDNKMLVVLTLRGQLCLFAKDGTELHRTSFVIDSSGLDDIISYHTYFTNSFGNPEKAYHNSVAVRGATIYILGSMHLLISRLLPWKERVQVLHRAGDWMGALDMAMRLYDGHTQGVIDLPRTVDAIREAMMPYLVELLLSYVDEGFSYISVSFCSQIGKVGELEGPKFADGSERSEIAEQYARVGGVAVEFCVHIKRTDILFDRIFSKFVSVKHGGTFLEILEPYILKDMLGCLPPEIMQALVEHYSAKGWLQRVEQCVLHMDISSLDFNQVVRLCREHGLFGALIYLFNRGLDDFRSPLEELLVVIQNSTSTDVAALGYRLLVYLKYCFQGLAFPPGHGNLSPSRLPSVRKELLQFLLEDSKPISSNLLRRFESLKGNFPNLCYLLLLDTEATLNVLVHAFPEDGCKVSDVSSQSLAASREEPGAKHQFEILKDEKLMAQSTVNVLVSILDLESDVIRSFGMDKNTEVWPSAKDVGCLLEFITFLVTCHGATISGRVLEHIFKYLTSHNANKTTDTRKEEKQVVSLLKTVSQMEWGSSYVLRLCADAHFYQACGLIYTASEQYVAALDSYMNDLNEPMHAFSFINTMLLQLGDDQASSFRSAVITRISELVKLSRECTYFLVIDHFNSESQNILGELHSHPQSLFLFLKTVIDVYLSGSLKFPVLDIADNPNAPTGRKRDMSIELEAYLERLSNFPKLLRYNMIQVTDEIAELYLELLCKYERNSVLKFLETFDNYRLEHCLHLCQEYGVIDAAAFLLERAGDVGSALGLMVTGVRDKINMLVIAVENRFSGTTSGIIAETDQFASVLKMEEVVCVDDILNASVGLCQRNTHRLDLQESESLWFRLLDTFSEPLRMCFRGTEFPVDMPSTTSDAKADESNFLSMWKVPMNRNCSNILRRVFTKFVGEIIDGMVGYIPLPAVMGKLLSDNANQEFGDFKLTILKMLGTYGYEMRILDTAKSLIEDDTFYSMGLLKKGATHAIAPQDATCCICGCSLSKGSTNLGIRIFNCGHSTHLQCESEDNEPSHSHFSTGCPICLPKKNSRAKSKSVHVEKGLVTTSTSSSQPAKGMSNVQHAHEPEIEKPCTLQQMSRFEILNNLHKSHTSLQVDALPQLRLSPPAIYYEKVQMGSSSLAGQTSQAVVKNDKSNKRWQLRDLKSKGSLNRFTTKSKPIWSLK